MGEPCERTGCESTASFAVYAGMGHQHTYYRLCDEHALTWPVRYRLAAEP